MANTNSNLITNLEAGPPVLNPVGKLGGRVRVSMDNFELAAADFDADGDTIVLCPVPTNARPISLGLAHDDLDSGSTVAFNAGLYNWTMADGLGTLIDEDAFASAVAAQAASSAFTNIIAEAGAVPFALMGDRFWEWAGAATDPGGYYALVLTATAANAGAQAGTLAFVHEYSID